MTPLLGPASAAVSLLGLLRLASVISSRGSGRRSLASVVAARPPRTPAATASTALASPLTRSALFVPASNARALAKASALPVDVILVDLEDSVAPSAKASARDAVPAALEAMAAAASASAASAAAAPGSPSPARRGGPSAVLRINAVGTPWFEDDWALVVRLAPLLRGVAIPKVESGAALATLAEDLPAGLALWAMVETPRGVLAAGEIAAVAAQASSDSCLLAGVNDLAKELRARGGAPARAPLLASLSAIVLAARAHGIRALDGVFGTLVVEDEEEAKEKDKAAADRAAPQAPSARARLRAECEQGADFGFDGKCATHPSQLAAINAAFSPSSDALAHAAAVVRAFDAAERAGSGVAVVDGRLVEGLHVEEARRIMAIAQAIAEQQQQA